MEEQEPLAAEPARIYLVGMPGSGKSTAGPLLAETLGWRFEDLDQQIEAEAGISIPRFFEEKGEEAFRTTETRLLHQTAVERRLVVATGGGAFCEISTGCWITEPWFGWTHRSPTS